ncbi:MAG: efflux transporter periplasmic adaptor subunit [Massilia sp.]|nr:efflux transporter periplasmic adaptor subunit [Massilia sp.]
MNLRFTPQGRAGLASILAGCALAACGPSKQAAPPPKPPGVVVLTVQRTSVPVTIELPGRTSPYVIAQVRARVDGIVQKRSFVEGADVRQNEPLYLIDPAPYRAALNSAEAAVQKAEANLATMNAQAERYKVLIASNAVSKQAYDNAIAAQRQAAADVASAKAAVATATIQLGYTNVVSPISGRSGISQVTQGAYVQAGTATLLTTIQQIDPIYVDLTQSSLEGLQLRRNVASGQLKPSEQDDAKVSLTMEDGTQYPLTGALKFSGMTVDPATGSVTVRALFKNPNHMLLPGMFVRARIEQGVNDNALLVPIRAVSHNPQGQATTLVVSADNKVAQRTVNTQGTFGESWVVTGGLREGERVIVAGQQKVQPGMLVQAVEAPGPNTATAPQMASAQAK